MELGEIYQNLGITYQSLRQFDLALKYFNQSLIIFKKFHHPNIPMILNYLGIVYEDQSQLQDALSNYQQALTIYRQSLSSTHYDIIQTEKNIQRLMVKLDN